MARASKYQKFDMDTISRDQIHGAEYNPRVISEDAKKRLRKMLAKHGLVQPLVWNRRTGNLVAGHQRLSALDALEKSQHYDLLVAVVDVSEREERILNVQLNNPSMQGEWDLDKLTELSDVGNISPEEFGFSESDASVLFGEMSQFYETVKDHEDVAEAKSTIKEIKKHMAESTEKMAEENSANFYFTVVCESDAQKKAILKALGIPDWENFVNGRVLAGKLGV